MRSLVINSEAPGAVNGAGCNVNFDDHPTVLIVGAGAVGSYMAARMHERGIDVSVLTGPARAEQIKLRGIRVSSSFGRSRRPISALAGPQIASAFDWVIFACRAHALDEAMAQAKSAIGATTVVVTLVDGGPNLNRIRQQFPSNPTVEGFVDARVRIDTDGYVMHRDPDAHVLIGNVEAHEGIASRLAAILAGRGLTAQVAGDLKRPVWARSIYLAAGIGATILTGRPLRDALKFLPGRQHFDHMIADGLRIAAAAGVSIDRFEMSSYARAFLLEGTSVSAPPRATDARGAGRDAVYLLKQMTGRAETLNIMVPALQSALSAHDDDGSESSRLQDRTATYQYVAPVHRRVQL